MDFIKPPTDNLYKFVAITGLVLIAFAVVWTEQHQEKLNDEIFTLQGEVSEIANLMAQAETLILNTGASDKPKYDIKGINTTRPTQHHKEELRRMVHDCQAFLRFQGQPAAKEVYDSIILNEEFKEMVKKQKGMTEEEYVEFAKTFPVDEFNRMRAQEGEKYLQLANKVAAIHAKIERLWVVVERYDAYKFQSRIAIGAGFLIAVVGFALWYRRVQRLQDQLLQKQLEQIISSLKPSQALASTQEKPATTPPLAMKIDKAVDLAPAE